MIEFGTNNFVKRLILSLAGLSLLGMAQASLAAQWVFVTGSQGDRSYYIDFDSIKGTGSTRSFWVREVDSRGMTVFLNKLALNCTAKQVGVLEMNRYNSDGSVDLAESFKNPVPQMSEIPPGTIGDAFQEYICSRITRQPAPTPQAKPTSEYPKAVCGDPAPSTPGTYKLYPVFADYSSGTLNYVVNNLCRDAIQTTRKNGRSAIQVASFTNISRAVDFAAFLEKRIGSGEVGEPTTIRY